MSLAPEPDYIARDDHRATVDNRLLSLTSSETRRSFTGMTRKQFVEL